MAKTTAQRQAEYRARRRQQGDTARLNTEVSLIAILRSNDWRTTTA